MITLTEKRNDLELEIRDLEEKALYRSMPPIGGMPGRTIQIDGNTLINFSGNNYLGLASHPQLIRAMGLYAERYGVGATASRLIAGNTEVHRELENYIAKWKHTPAALLFGSGYQANIGVLTSLAGPDDLIVSDELNHASIIDGCRLSKAKTAVYPHFDLDRLSELLAPSDHRRKIVVTETVFSMDGDYAPITEMKSICNNHGALLVLDEAHAGGVLGPQGRGWAAHLGVEADITMGTLGKAMGVSGAYVAAGKKIIELIINKARSLIYTTASSPALIGTALEALKLVASEEGEARRVTLMNNVNLFNKLLLNIGIKIHEPSHIVPIHIGGSAKAMAVSARCRELGVFAHGIRYPTVPEGSARIRFTLMSEHTGEDIEKGASALSEALKNY